MTFNSLQYMAFLPLVFFAFHLVKGKGKWITLLLASYVFFASFGAPQTLVSLVLVTIVSFSFGLLVGKCTDERTRAAAYWTGTALCLLILILVKYVPFLSSRVTPSSPLAFLLNTIGVSYFVFQAISYLTDIQLGIISAETHFGIYALSLAFFPKSAQGPIERSGNLLPQLHSSEAFTYERGRSALLLFAYGLAKKVIIADRLAPYVSSVYGNMEAFTGVPILVATYAYALQIFFDFSGYTDMARASARLFGIELTENFTKPYSAPSIAEFWRRWHISFSRWILDYIFKPLQMSWRRLGNLGSALALFVAFLISGIWHGATFGFLIWGGLHGLYLAASIFYTPFRKKLLKKAGIREGKLILYWRRFTTFNLVCIAWIFFRTGSLKDGLYAFTHLFDFTGSLSRLEQVGIVEYIKKNILLGRGLGQMLIVSAALALYILSTRIKPESFDNAPVWLRWTIYYSLLLVLVFFTAPATKFVYFQF